MSELAKQAAKDTDWHKLIEPLCADFDRALAFIGPERDGKEA